MGKKSELKFTDLRNQTEHTFTDISSETERVYYFCGVTLKIDNPIALNVSDSGGHRILDASGNSFYIPPTWIAIRWKAKDSAPHFVK